MSSKIHVVDDDNDIRELMLQYLEINNFKVSSSSSAEDAILYLKKNSVDLVITDINMPGINGLELTRHIKKKYDISVIIITGYPQEYSYENAVGTETGANDFVFKPIRFEELTLRINRALEEQKLKRERDEMIERLKELAITDSLTNLFNSRHFSDQLTKELDRHSRYNHPISLLLLDIDFFKSYNDTYGHVEGDKVLAGLGWIIKYCLRTMDSGYRYGGEEFTIILPETKIAEATLVAERIQKLLKEKPVSAKKEREITVSIGITEYLHGESSIKFVKRADKAMYMSKKNGRNKITILTDDKPLDN